MVQHVLRMLQNSVAVEVLIDNNFAPVSRGRRVVNIDSLSWAVFATLNTTEGSQGK